MQPDDAASLVRHFLSFSFDQGLHVVSAEVTGLSATPLLTVRFEDERRPDVALGAWWDFAGWPYEKCVHDPKEVEWLAGHAKIYVEEIFDAGPPIQLRPRDAAGVHWCAMDSLELQHPPSRAS
jgi:hypothetical protein